jgi:hypothetical protein
MLHGEKASAYLRICANLMESKGANKTPKNREKQQDTIIKKTVLLRVLMCTQSTICVAVFHKKEIMAFYCTPCCAERHLGVSATALKLLSFERSADFYVKHMEELVIRAPKKLSCEDFVHHKSQHHPNRARRGRRRAHLQFVVG